MSFDLTAIDPAKRTLLRHWALFARVYVANAPEDGVGFMRIPLADVRAFAAASAR